MSTVSGGNKVTKNLEMQFKESLTDRWMMKDFNLIHKIMEDIVQQCKIQECLLSNMWLEVFKQLSEHPPEFFARLLNLLIVIATMLTFLTLITILACFGYLCFTEEEMDSRQRRHSHRESLRPMTIREHLRPPAYQDVSNVPPYLA